MLIIYKLILNKINDINYYLYKIYTINQKDKYMILYLIYYLFFTHIFKLYMKNL